MRNYPYRALGKLALWVVGFICVSSVAFAADPTGPFGLTALEVSFMEALALIALACFFVPIANRFNLGTVIGYLAAGVVSGVALNLSFSSNPEDLLHFAEFGVVLFLFVIGLEFRPQRLWDLRGVIFGRGLMQVLACATVLGGAAYAFGLDWRAALIVGLGLALSSTALVMREIDEGGERRTPFGETAIAVLLFEDLAIVPLLLLVALIAPTSGDASMIENVTAVATGIGAIVFLIMVGRYGLDPMFRVIARTRTPELMTAASLGVVIFASLVMALAGLSYAMGAFIAGVMLADSAFRHEVEADIEPFRGLFLGLFFIAVGLLLDLDAVADNWLLIVLAVPLLMLLKGLAIYGVSRAFGSEHKLALRISLAMAQHGEFGFVLFAAASAAFILDVETTSVVVSIVTLSMALSSQSDRLYRRIVGEGEREQMDESYEDAGGSVLVVGFGRVGQLVGQSLLAEGITVTFLDHDADRIREAARFGSRVHFGDGTRRDVLQAAGAGEARAIVLATDEPEVTHAIARLVRKEFPAAQLVLRAYDRIQAVRLADGGADVIVRETYGSALELGAYSLMALGYAEQDATDVVARVRELDETRLQEQIALARGAEDRAEIVEAIAPEPLSKARTT
ncbi:MAG: monovalent cation:proton antiporter-2 (CPA2) family protein [Dinoroseobacter sp.]|nr:monovalent cation:proton antiporter-2 (CPA2) family protein [Dinoroseobacter sp.]